MLRIGVIGTIVLLLLAGCGDRGGYATMPMAAKTTPEQGGQAQTFAYNHTLGLGMARQYIDPRFARARDRCLKDAGMGCKLLSASLTNQDSGRYSYVTAYLVVTLPHDKIDAFEKSLLEPIAGESISDVSVDASSTEAENVQHEAADVDNRLAQLNDYRDRLTALLKRSDLRADDLIKIEGELSNVQSQIEQLTSQKLDIGERINRERLTIAFGEHPSLVDATRPISQIWQNAIQSLGNSAADALEFLIEAVPWLPIAAGGLFLIAWFWRLIRRKRADKATD